MTTSQAARNVLRDAGAGLADNTADFLGHLNGAREARGAKAVRPGTLLILDEASMMSMADGGRHHAPGRRARLPGPDHRRP